MVAVLSRVDTWIKTQLAADATLAAWADGGFWADNADQGVTGKVVLYAFLGGSDKPIAYGYALYLIRAVAEGTSYGLVVDAADRIDAAMTVPVAGTVVGDTRISYVKRDQPHQSKQADNGIPVVYMGGIYRIEYAD